MSGRFFDPVGMGRRPAKFHEKLQQIQGIPRRARWFFAPVTAKQFDSNSPQLGHDYNA
jgi:hypothetical protein